MNTPAPASTPSNPSELHREIGGLSFRLDAEGLTIGVEAGPDDLRFDVGETLALLTFLRSPGVARLIGRLWLSQQHAAALADATDAGDEDEERRHKMHAGRRAA